MADAQKVQELSEQLKKAMKLIEQQKAVIDNAQSVTAPVITNAIDSNFASARTPQIPKFKGERHEDAMLFVRKFERESAALRWNKDVMHAKFGIFLEDAAEQWFRVFVENAKDDEKPKAWDDLKAAFLSHFLNGNYRNYLMRQISERKWKENESLPAYVTTKIALCRDFQENMEDASVIEHVYSGLDEHVKAQFLTHDPSDLKMLMEIAKRLERSLEKDRKVFGSTPSVSESAEKRKDCDRERRKTCALQEDAAKVVIDQTALQQKVDELIAASFHKKNFPQNNRNRNFYPNQQRGRGGFGNRGRGNFSRFQNTHHNHNPTQNQNDARQTEPKSVNHAEDDMRGRCYNCRNFGHMSRECAAPKVEWKKNEQTGNLEGTVSMIDDRDKRNLTFIKCRLADTNCRGQ